MGGTKPTFQILEGFTASSSPSNLATGQRGRRDDHGKWPRDRHFFQSEDRTSGKEPTLSVPSSLSLESDFSSLFAPGAKNTDHMRPCASNLNPWFNTRWNVLDYTSQRKPTPPKASLNSGVPRQSD